MSPNYTAAEAVAKGAALLDTVRPGWDTSIDLNTLDIASSFHCILGQIFGGYQSGLEVVFNTSYPEIETRYAHGFSACGYGSLGYGDVTGAWRDFITERRNGYQPSPEKMLAAFASVKESSEPLVDLYMTLTKTPEDQRFLVRAALA